MSTPRSTTTANGRQPEPHAELEQDVAAVESGEPVAVPSIASLAAGVAATLGQGRAVAQETAVLGRELLRITRGNSQVGPDPMDRRFADPAWRTNPLYRRIGQSYLASSEAFSRLTGPRSRSERTWP